MFEIKIDDAKYWKSIINSIVALIDEGSLNITKEGISLKAMDPSGISMISFFMPNKAFSKYTIDKNASVGLNLDNLSKVLSSSRNGEQLVMKESSGRFDMEFATQNSKRRYKLPIIDVGKEPEKEPKIDFESFVEVKSDSFKEILKDATLLSSYIGFKTDKSTFVVLAKGDAGELEEEHLDSADMIKKIDVSKATSATFNLEYLERIVGGCPLDSSITLHMKNDEPLKIDYKIGEASLIYYLAPYIEG